MLLAMALHGAPATGRLGPTPGAGGCEGTCVALARQICPRTAANNDVAMMQVLGMTISKFCCGYGTCSQDPVLKGQATIVCPCPQHEGGTLNAITSENSHSVHFPDCRPDEVAGVEVTRHGKRDQSFLTVDERIDARGRNYFWLGFAGERGTPPAGTVIGVVFNRPISMTPLHMNLTQVDALEGLRAVF
jgi:hypothetical protein